MTTAGPLPASVELFYSYAHSDEPLCRELQKHLTALKRSGVIRDWYDRKIEPGDEWNEQIHEAMERAGIILLLISADFLASKYIFEFELPFALKRHEMGRARVIPVLLRPVEWHDSPFAKLQVLPTEARAVTLWPNQDEAFSDIAGRLRELLYSERLHKVISEKAPERVAGKTQERVLDAAIASSVVVDEPTDLVIMVRPTESGGLKAILQTDPSYSPTSDDVRSETFELEFPADEFGKILPANLELALESPGFDPPKQRKKIRIPPVGDSGISVFMLTPKRAGKLRLNLQAISGGIEIGSRALVTTSVPAAGAQPILSYGVTSLPLTAAVDQRRTSGPGEFTRMAAPAPSAPPKAEIPRPVLVPTRYEQGGVAGPKARPALARSSRGVWVGIASSAAVIALVSSTLLWNGKNTAGPPLPNPVASPSPGSGGGGGGRTPIGQPQAEIVALNRAIQHEPTAAGLYLQRARALQRAGNLKDALPDAERAAKLAPNDPQAHLLYGQLLESAHLTNQAIEQYRRVQALKPTPEVHSVATQRIGALERGGSNPNR